MPAHRRCSTETSAAGPCCLPGGRGAGFQDSGRPRSLEYPVFTRDYTVAGDHVNRRPPAVFTGRDYTASAVFGRNSDGAATK